MKVLNVGGGSKDIPLPEIYDGWEHVLLDIDPKGKPDIVCDAREMLGIEEKFDSVYCSHCLEHFFPWDGGKVLRGIKHVLKPDGWVFLRVPDLLTAVVKVVKEGLSFDSRLYVSAAGDVNLLDMLYGKQDMIEQSGVDWMAHKTGFTPALMEKRLKEAGFKDINIIQENLELLVFANND